MKQETQKKEKERIQNRNAKKISAIKNKKRLQNKKKGNKKKGLLCGLCEDELISDTEDDLLKNIGCDMCPNWFNLA